MTIEEVRESKCGFCERVASFHAVLHDDVKGCPRPLLFIRCDLCRAVVGVVEMNVPEEVTAANSAEMKDRE